MARTAVAYTPGEEAVETEDLELVAVVSTDDSLAQALQHVASGEASALFVSRLHAVASSLGELIRLLDWLREAGADLVAADVGLDTASRAGRRTVALLREIDGWGRESRGRPGLTAGSPELAQRIAEMRERGLSLHAIAEALNEEGVPTPRGGARWRPSSVQSALGYRRPRPPAPGAPPVPPPPPAKGPGPGERAPRPGPGGRSPRPGPPRKGPGR